jgi:hypothetical protein
MKDPFATEIQLNIILFVMDGAGLGAPRDKGDSNGSGNKPLNA